MEIFGFVKKLFFIGLTILSDFTNENSFYAIPLSCISMNNQEWKTRPQVLVLKQVNVVVVVIILTMSMQKFVFLIL